MRVENAGTFRANIQATSLQALSQLALCEVIRFPLRGSNWRRHLSGPPAGHSDSHQPEHIATAGFVWLSHDSSTGERLAAGYSHQLGL